MQVENGVDARKKEHCIGWTVGDRFTVQGWDHFCRRNLTMWEKPRPWAYGGYLTFGYPQIIHFGGIFHYKPSILGIPPWWRPIWEHLVKIASVARKPNNFFFPLLRCWEEVLLPTLSWTYQDCYRLNLTFLPTLEPLHTACLCLRLQNRTCVLLLFWGLLFVLGLGWGWMGY